MLAVTFLAAGCASSRVHFLAVNAAKWSDLQHHHQYLDLTSQDFESSICRCFRKWPDEGVWSCRHEQFCRHLLGMEACILSPPSSPECFDISEHYHLQCYDECGFLATVFQAALRDEIPHDSTRRANRESWECWQWESWELGLWTWQLGTAQGDGRWCNNMQWRIRMHRNFNRTSQLATA